MKIRKKQKKQEIFSNSDNLNYKELQKLHQKLSNYLSKLNKEYFIPLSSFTTKLAPLETVTKFLIENQNLTIKQTSQILNRSQKTIWQAYSSSKKKYHKKFIIKQEQFSIPISIFSNRKLSILEALVSYLKEIQNLKLSQIASLLDRDPRTIWTSYSRARRKYVK